MIRNYNRCEINVIVPTPPETAALPSWIAEEISSDDDQRYVLITIKCSMVQQPTWTEERVPLPPQSYNSDRRHGTLLVPSCLFLAEFQPDIIRHIVSDMNIRLKPEDMDRLALQTQRAAMAQNPNPNPNPSSRVLPIVARVELVNYLRSPADLEELMVNYAARVSALPTVSATKASVEALECVTIGSKEIMRDQERCSICMEDYLDNHDHDHDRNQPDGCDDQRAVRMPCSHVYHKGCIVKWLEENHRCPLCRYAVPTN